MPTGVSASGRTLVATGMTLWSAAASSRNVSRVGNTGPMSRIGAFRRVSLFGTGDEKFSASKACSGAGVAGGTVLMHGHQQGVLITVKCNPDDVLGVARGVTLTPVIGS